MRRKLAQTLASNNRRKCLALKPRSAGLFHQDRTKKVFWRWRTGFGSHNLRGGCRLFDQPCVGIKILLQVGQAPIGKVLIAARTEKEIVRNINRLCWSSALDFAGRSDLFF